MGLLPRLCALLDNVGTSEGSLAHGPSGLHILRFRAPSGIDASVYRPLLCLVLQGAKEVATGTRTLRVADGQSLLVSHALPVLSRITEAQPDKPYVALVFPIDLDLLRGLAADLAPGPGSSPTDPFSISVSPVDAALEDAFLRYLRQCEQPDQRGLLAPITRREIHARLLMGPQSGSLRKLLWHHTTSSRIFRITQEIQSDPARPVAVGDLAQQAGMSSSAFFEHFKSVTGTSPLQYQKDLRLLRARELLRTTPDKVSRVAFGVGYESSAQFSREYARKFGRSPRQDRVLPEAH